MEIGEKYLPIGTVVTLKNGTKKVMILGFCAAEKEDTKVFDYSGCLYPEGIIDPSKAYLFNHEQIEEIYHLGLADDDEEKVFKEKLNKVSKLI